MKKIIALFCSLLLFILPIVSFSAGAVASAPVRQINVVYDDSISMIKQDGGDWVDTWCQAKYAMEVFAAMLGENDSMSVYAMSDFEKTNNAAPKLHLVGSEGMSENVSKVHNMVTYAQNTPFNTTRKAYNDLLQINADEKWLVVLTDGEFEGVKDGEVNKFFNNKSNDVNVIFLGIGKSAEQNGVKSNESNNVFAYYTKNNSEILNKITEICTRVFNIQKLTVSASTKKISFDVPMESLTIFAQGENVKINGIVKPDGNVHE